MHSEPGRNPVKFLGSEAGSRSDASRALSDRGLAGLRSTPYDLVLSRETGGLGMNRFGI